MSFDSDILDYGYTYEDIIDYISQISDDEIKITDISEKSSLKNRTITMKINEKEVSVNLSKDNTCFDESLVYQINKVLEESKSEKLLYYIKMRLLYRWSHFYFLPAVSVHNDCEKGKKFVIIINYKNT